MWDRRQFLTGLGLATLGACKRAPTANVEPPASPKPLSAPPIDSMPPDANKPTAFGEPLDPGFRRMGRSPLAFEGEELLELAPDGLIRRNAALAEIARVPLADPQSFAVLQDRSILVLTVHDGDTRVHHVVGDKVVTTTDSRAKLVLPTSSPKLYWAIAPTTVKRTNLGSTDPKVDFFLPENTDSMTAQVASDGSVVMSHIEGLLHIDRAMSKFVWDYPAEFLAAGSEPNTVWSAHSDFEALPAHLVLRKLAGATATAIATHKLAAGEQFVHLSSAGTDAAAIVARTVRANEAALTLIVFDAKGERWRTPLGDRTSGYFVALSPTRAVVLASRGVMRAWNRATGKAA